MGFTGFFRILQFIFNIICLALCAAHFRTAKAFALGVSSANMIYNIYTLFIVPQMEQKTFAVLIFVAELAFPILYLISCIILVVKTKADYVTSWTVNFTLQYDKYRDVPYSTVAMAGGIFGLVCLFWFGFTCFAFFKYTYFHICRNGKGFKSLFEVYVFKFGCVVYNKDKSNNYRNLKDLEKSDPQKILNKGTTLDTAVLSSNDTLEAEEKSPI